jgi:DNA primase
MESRLKAQLRIAALPDGLDPDELAYADVERWRKVIAEAQPIVDYYLALVGREEDLNSARGKAAAVERMAPIIWEIANPVEREHQIQRLGRLVRIDERLVAEQVMRGGRPGPAAPAGAESRRSADASEETPAPDQSPETPQKRSSAAGPGRSSPVSGREEHLLGCLLSRPDLLTLLDAQLIELSVPPLSPDDFTSTENRAVVAALQTNLAAAAAAEPGGVVAFMPPALVPHCQGLLEQAQRHPALTEEKLLKDLGDLVLRLRQEGLRQQVGQIRYLIGELEEGGNRDQLRPYQELMATYSAQLGQLHKLLGSRTMIGALARLRTDTHER